MKNLIVISHPDENSFCHNGVFQTVLDNLSVDGEDVIVADLYRDNFEQPKTDIIKTYKENISWADRIYFISPIW